METNKNLENPIILWLKVTVLVIGMIFVVGFTIYVQQPEPIEINQIAFAGKETINNNNKYAFDLLSWAPGYTDQALIQIKNNTNKVLSWNLSFENLDEVDTSLLESIGIYIKENPTNNDVLPMYNSVITDGYEYFGTLSEIKNTEILNGKLNKDNEFINLSILLHVGENYDIEETQFDFRNILKISAHTDNIFIDKNFE